MNIGPLHLIGTLNLGLALGLASLWVDQDLRPLKELLWVTPAPIKPELSEPVMLMGDPNAGNLAIYSSVVSRPVFAPDRRPPPPPPPPKPPAPPPPPDPFASVELMGLFTGQNSGALAKVEGRMRRLKIKDTVGDWTLHSVDGREAIFKRGEEERKLRLNYAKMNTVVASPSPAPRLMQQPSGLQSLPINQQEEQRERLRRRNEFRAQNGQPPVTE